MNETARRANPIARAVSHVRDALAIYGVTLRQALGVRRAMRRAKR